jgi:hypothetical protein
MNGERRERPLTEEEAHLFALFLTGAKGKRVRQWRLAITAAMYVAALHSGDQAPRKRVAALQSLRPQEGWALIGALLNSSPEGREALTTAGQHE